MSTQPNPTAAKHSEPVLDAFAQQLVRKIDQHLDGHQVSGGDAFVVSLYGEWGIGKTHALKQIQAHFQRRADAFFAQGNTSKTLVLPVWFDPWRYEHEDHLVIPMLHTIAMHIQSYRLEIQKKLDALQRDAQGVDNFIAQNIALGQTLIKSSKTATTMLWHVSKALLKGIKFKAAPLGVGLDIDGKAMIEHGEKASSTLPQHSTNSQTNDLQEPLPSELQQQSLYFSAEQFLKQVAFSSDGLNLRLVVLVDDLDRCLPEKAIQVLESVKLFLNVPGFSFVLAVDDEVVERGIAYRYRNYKAEGQALPISGHQYLEKVVHMPLHLPRWPLQRAKEFLSFNYPDLYLPTPDSSGTDQGDHSQEGPRRDERMAHSKPSRAASGREAANDVNAELLDLVLRATPLVPRKLVRFSEGLQHMLARLREVHGLNNRLILHAARVVAMQQLYPELYRHLRSESNLYWRMFSLTTNHWDEVQYRDGQTLHELENAYQGARADQVASKKTAGNPLSPSKDEIAAEQSAQTQAKLGELRALLACVQAARSQRASGNPVWWFDANPPLQARQELETLGLDLQSFSDLLFALQAPPQEPSQAGVGIPSQSRRLDESLPIASVSNVPATVAALLELEDLTRQAMLEKLDLQGKRLPDTVISVLIDAVKPVNGKASLQVQSLAWLREMASILTARQLAALYAQAQVLEYWAGNFQGVSPS